MNRDDALLVADEQAREDALDITRSFIVQAPAGSGKTELLIQRYLRLLGIVDDPEEILAITFTRKAAGEMQLRVLDALRAARTENQPAEAHRRLTNRLATAALQRSEARNWNLVGSPRRMRIQTLDSLNRTIARAQPLSSPESSAGVRIVTDADLSAVRDAAALATLDWLAESGSAAVATREVLTHVDNNTWLYVSYLSAMLKTRDQWLPFIGSGAIEGEEADELRERFEHALEFAVTDHLARVRESLTDSAFNALPPLFDYAAGSLMDAGATSPITTLAGCMDWPGTESNDVSQWQAIADMLLLKGKAQFRKSVTKAQGFPVTDRERKSTITGVLESLASTSEIAPLLHGVRSLPPVRYSDEQWSVLLALFRLLPLAVSELKRLFAEQGVADHIEVALNAAAALGSAESPGDTALLLDYKVSHILVDEMQDTSSAQYRMLEALTGGWAEGDGRTLFCVGDPMQSIYRFRNAEVGQFLLARQFGIGRMRLESLVLRRNFRSGGNLVGWFNSVFPSILAPRNEPLHGAVSYSEAVAADHLDGLGQVVFHPVFGTETRAEARIGCEVVQEILDRHTDDELAVLVRGRTQLPALLGELRRAGIPYTAIEIDKLTDLPEIIDVLALTRAGVHPSDRIAWLGVLRAPWIGLSWSDLHALAHSDVHRTVIEMLDDNDRLTQVSAEGRASLERARPILDALLAPRRATTLRQRVEECWIRLGGPAALHDATEIENVYRFLDLVEANETGGTLPDVAALESILDDQKVSSGRRTRVQVMTMHKSKGLEFDHVLLYGLGRKPGGGNPGVLSWFDMPGEHGDERKVISPIGPRRLVDRDPVHRYIGAAVAEKEIHEQGRLLYVACTRARKGLHIVGNVALSNDRTEYRVARSDSLLHRLWPAVESAYANAFTTWTLPDDSLADAEWIEPVRRCLSEPWELPEILPLPGPDDRFDPEAEREDVEFYWVGTEARIAGTLVHRWLQLITESGASPGAGELDVVTRRWLREMGIADDTAGEVTARVVDAVKEMLADGRGRWLLHGEGHAELALTGLYEGAVESIIVDRVRVDEDGTHWIVDYKTSTHEGGNLAGFLSAEVTRYRPQLQKYAAVYAAWAGVRPRCALYFPLLQQFVEIQ
ncbi:MAG: UvrD-helicase domain-containing protein [Woeseiaceae bacterium]|nr:UvrD-helicase domain-containing protein [Woeseiaceae bacterium]